MFSLIPILFAVSAPEQPLPAVLATEAPALAPVQDAEEEKKMGIWTGSVEGSGMNTDGNTNNLRLTVLGDAVREFEEERYTLHAEWIYAKDDGDKSEDRGLLTGKYDRDITDRTYWLINAAIGYDEIANVDMRYTAGAGLGHKFVDTDKWKFEGEAGLNYFVEDLKGESSDGYVAARLFYDLKYIHSETWTFDHKVAVFPSLEDKDDVVGRMDTGLQAKLSDKWYAKARWIWDYDNTPAEDSDRNDQMHLLTLGWTF